MWILLISWPCGILLQGPCTLYPVPCTLYPADLLAVRDPCRVLASQIFADSLNNMGFPAAGRWGEVESVFYSWNPDESGRLQWNVVRNRMTGGRLVRVQQTKHNTVSYYKQASRAGEGFGNRSGSRFHHETTSFVGPGKYSPAAQGQVKDRTGGGGHSGKLKTTAP